MANKRKDKALIKKIARQDTAEAMFDVITLGYNKQKEEDDRKVDYKTVEKSLDVTVRNIKDMNRGLSSINSSLKSMTGILEKALLAQQKKAYSEEEAQLEAKPEDKPKLAGDGEKKEEKGFLDLVKEFFTNPAIIAAFSGLVYLFLPKDIKEKINSFFSGFSDGITGTKEPLSTFQIALASAAAGLTTYLGATVLKSVSDAISTTLSLITKAKSSFGKLKGKGALKELGKAALKNKAAVAGVAVGGATAVGLSLSSDQEKKIEGGKTETGVPPSPEPTPKVETKPPVSSTGTASVTTAPGATNDPMNADLNQYVIKKDTGVDLEGLHPNLKKRLAGMAKEYNDKTGKKIQINSAYRDPKKQLELFQRIGAPRAAPPGKSKHEFGAAFDMNSSDADTAIKLGLFEKYGFTRPIPSETWHVEPIENRGRSFPDNPVVPGAPVIVASAKGAVVPSSGEKLPESVTKPSPAATVSSSQKSSSKNVVAELLAAARETNAQHTDVTSADVSEAEMIKSKSGIMDSISPEQVASNRLLNERLTSKAGSVFGFNPKDVVMTDRGAEIISKSEGVEASGMENASKIINNNIGGTEFISGKPSQEAPLEIPSPIANRGTLNLGIKHSSAYFTATA